MGTDFDYRAYLESPEWQDRRKRAINRAGGRCQLCNRNQFLQVHHRTYERIGNEDPWDLTVLCRRCHAKHHDVLPFGATKGTPNRERVPRDARSLEEIERAIIALIPEWGTGRMSAKTVAPLISSTRSRAGSGLRRLWKKGVLVKYEGKGGKSYKPAYTSSRDKAA